MICYAKCFIQLDYGWLFNSGLLFSGGQIVSLFQKMSCCLSPKAYLNRFELLSLLRMKAFFPFKLQIDLILFSFIQDAEGVIAMKNQSDAFYTYNLLLLFAVCVPVIFFKFSPIVNQNIFLSFGIETVNCIFYTIFLQYYQLLQILSRYL